MSKAVKLKQAKAAYKKRQGGTLNVTEQRRIEREIQLQERARSAKEREKARVAAARKRDAEQQRLKTAQAVLLATQRKVDIFGHKSSQFHLGAFFQKASDLGRSTQTAMSTDEDNDFGELEIDAFDLDQLDAGIDDEFESDEGLLDALQNIKTPGLIMAADDDTRTSNGQSQDMGMEGFEDFLESSTQIERQIDAVNDHDTKLTPSLGSSFSLELTTEDIERLDPSTKVLHSRTMMAPPVRPRQSLKSTVVEDITFTQLESFVDEDPCLSQL